MPELVKVEIGLDSVTGFLVLPSFPILASLAGYQCTDIYDLYFKHITIIFVYVACTFAVVCVGKSEGSVVWSPSFPPTFLLSRAQTQVAMFVRQMSPPSGHLN